MNAVFGMLGIESWKALLSALLLPPLPFLLLSLWGGLLLWGRRGLGWFVLLLASALLWLSCCSGAAQALSGLLLKPPPALSAERIAGLKQGAPARRDVAIVVLGGGREVFAPEYGVSSLSAASLERLRYGLWLGRETGVPVAFSGGVGWGASDGLSEAQIAARIAGAEFNRPLRWTEDQSRDTRENAAGSIGLLAPAGITEIVLVTHGWHMPRALRAFEGASNGRVHITPAPIGLAPRTDRQSLMWLPSAEGFQHMRNVLHEWLGLLAGS